MYNVFIKYYSDYRNQMVLSSATSTANCEEIASDFAVNQQIAQLEDILQCWKLLSTHFEKERSGVGLHGLYTKYKDYAEPLAKLFLIFGRVIITLQIKEDQGTHADTRKNPILILPAKIEI